MLAMTNCTAIPNFNRGIALRYCPVAETVAGILVFEGGMVNPRVHEFLRIISQPRDRQKGDAVMSVVIRNERYVVGLKVDCGAKRRRRTNRSSPAVESSLDSRDGTWV